MSYDTVVTLLAPIPENSTAAAKAVKEAGDTVLRLRSYVETGRY